jgi:nitrogen fixation NifU-like protein
MDALEQMYQEVILEESQNPYHKAFEIDDPNKSHQYNPSCGDDISMLVKLDGETIAEITWAGEGCSISQASASIMVALLEGKTTTQALHLVEVFKKLMNSRGEGISEEELDELGDASVFTGTSKFPARIKCALLGWAAFEGALNNVSAGQGVSSAHSSHEEENEQ